MWAAQRISFRGLLELGLKRPAVVARELGDVLPPDIELGQNRQADGTPQRVPDDQHQRHPDVAVEVLVGGRPWCGIVVDARPFHTGAIAFGGRVVQGEDQPWADGQARQHEQKQSGGERFGLVPHGGDEIIIGLPVDGHPSGPQPGGHGASACGEQHPHQQHWQPPSASPVQPGRQPLDPLRPLLRTSVLCHPWLSGLRGC